MEKQATILKPVDALWGGVLYVIFAGGLYGLILLAVVIFKFRYFYDPSIFAIPIVFAFIAMICSLFTFSIFSDVSIENPRLMGFIAGGLALCLPFHLLFLGIDGDAPISDRLILFAIGPLATTLLGNVGAAIGTHLKIRRYNRKGNEKFEESAPLKIQFSVAHLLITMAVASIGMVMFLKLPNFFYLIFTYPLAQVIVFPLSYWIAKWIWPVNPPPTLAAEEA